MTVEELLVLLGGQAPVRLAESWDNAGLIVGSPESVVESVLVALDCTGEILDEAITSGADLILTHHPLIFEPLRALRLDSYLGKTIERLIKSGISLVCLHTNLDKAAAGLNDILAEAFELTDVEVVLPERSDSYKLVVYVPVDSLGQVQDALFGAGAGAIGNYQGCSFYGVGKGGFEPMAGAKPVVRGEVVGTGSTRPLEEKGKGKREEVEEARLEVQVPKANLEAVLTALRGAHPYEEIAYDLFDRMNFSDKEGLGRIGNLRKAIKGSELLALTGEKLGTTLKYSGNPDAKISRLAVCTGSGGDLIGKVAAMGADALITGDLKYHTAFAAGGLTLPLLIDAGHHETESYSLKIWASRLKEGLLKEKVNVMYAEAERNPWHLEVGSQKSEVGSRKLDRGEKGEELPEKITILCDGGARGNPGPAGIGAIFLDETGNEIDRISEFIGEATNNIAEYTALIRSLEKAKEMGVRNVKVITDSELMDRQMRGQYKVKNEGLKPLFGKARSIAESFDNFSIAHAGREALERADKLVNEAIDEKIGNI